MFEELSERIADLRARAGLGVVPVPVLGAALAVCVALAGWALVRWVAPGGGPEIVAGPAAEPAAASAVATRAVSTEPTRPAEVVVHVVGAVRHPGVYRLPTGSRGVDAVDAAGGLAPGAYPDGVNLAREIADGDQLAVPAKGEVPAAGAASVAGGGGAAAARGSGGAAAPVGKVDLNRATEAELDTLPGIGPATAKKIVADRQANGPFRSPEDLMRVPGLGPKKVEALKDLVTAGG